MVARKIEKLSFSGAGKVHDQGPDGLASVVRKMAQDMARTRINLFTDMTDSSTGVAVFPAVLAVQAGKGVAAFTESGTASTPKAGFDTAIGKIADAMAVMAEHMNRINASLGMDLIVDNTTGSVATQGTIPALDKSTSAAAATLLDVVTGRLRLQTIKVNMARLFGAGNRIAVAIGDPKMTSSLGQGFDGTVVLDAIAASGTAVDGTSLSTTQNSVTNTELDSIANNIATMAAFLEQILGAQLADLTGSLSGTPSDTDIEVQTVPSVAVDGAATTSSPKAGFDTELVLIENNLSDLTNRVNGLLKRNDFTAILTDSTGVTPNAALEDIAVDLTAVDGSSGTVAIDFVTGSARMLSVNDSMASITAKVNILAGVYGLQTLTDASSGTIGSTIANLAATATGVSGVASTILDTVMDTWLAALLNNFETLQVKLNDMTSSDESTDQPLQVVAWDA